jgi:hypothetical protein
MTATTGLLGKNLLKWKANSLAGNDETYWMRIPPKCTTMCIGVGWTATGAPIGELSIEVSNHGDDSMAGSVYPVTITTNPAGSAGSVMLDGITTSAEYIKMRYTRSSAGTGAVFTDETQVAGTFPTIIFKG